ncbi:SU10 major capsid protein [Idiomarina abyssalis]|uniref:SU10 major capsid protein n=1 Tax=Idiomarina abyssalis TaxID=86102 RepID=UPI003A928599
MAIQGFRHTSNIVTDGRPLNWRAGILMAYPNGMMPLTGLTSLMKSESTDDPEYNWWEKPMQTRRVQVSADLDAVQTAVTVDAGAYGIKSGDVLMVEGTDELLFVTADPVSDTALVVQRAFAGSTAATLTVATDNPFLVVIGSAHEEGSDAPTGVAFDPNKRFNYTQIFRNTFEATRTAKKTRVRTGDQVKEMKRECLELHGVDMERAFLFGKRFEGTRNGKPFRTTGGILSQMAAGNKVDFGTTYASGIDMEDFEEECYKLFLEGSNEKLALTGNRAVLTVNQIVRKNSHFNIQTGIKEYGMNVMRFVTPFGTLVFKTHPLFNQMRGAAGYAGMESSMVILDAGELKYRYLDGSDTQYQPELNAAGIDGDKSGYLTEAGIELHHPTYHHQWKGLNIPALVDS